MNPEPVKPTSGEKPATTSKPRLKFGKGLDPKEMQRRSVVAKKRNREALAAGPRETIAGVLHRRADLLALATEKALEDCASEDANLRKSGRAALPRLLDQALGRIETRTAQSESTEAEGLPMDRERRMRLIAELEARLEEQE